MDVEPFDAIKSLDVRASRPDLRRDLHVFVNYVKEHEVKRGHRDNMLPKSDARRLAKLCSDPEADQEVMAEGYSGWLEFVDRTALMLGFVQYDTKGEYAGFTSQNPSFPDNFIDCNDKVYDAFLRRSLARQEALLVETLLKQFQGDGSEFFSVVFLSRLDRFSTYGCATGVIPLIDFSQPRAYLLKALATLPTGQWLSTESLIKGVKRHDPYFLIPKNPKYEKKWEQDRGRYDNFREGEPYGGEIIKPTDPDAFERVEGRYIERFLEGLPFVLGYVDVAYLKKHKSQYPSLGALPAFRVNERLPRALAGLISEPTVRITPAFEVYVQSELYPARVLEQLEQIAELVSADATTTYRLTKQKVAAARAAKEALDPIKLLESITTTPLPDNVRRELDDWSRHGEKFVLYTGCSLLETQRHVAVPDRCQVECVEPGTYVVREPEKLFAELEQQELAPIRIAHADAAFAELPQGVRSSIGVKARKPKAVSKPQITLMKVKRIQLLCPDRDFLIRLQTMLAGAGCPVEADSKNLSLVYSDRYESEVGKVIGQLRNDYQLTIENKG